jgi:hypothetical protein
MKIAWSSPAVSVEPIWDYIAGDRSHHARRATAPLGESSARTPARVVAAALLLMLTCAASVVLGATGWKRSTEKDHLTGESRVFVRGYTGAVQSLRSIDLLRAGDGFAMRFVVPQTASPVISANGIINAPEELGDTLAWSVNGKEAHRVTPDLSREKSALVNVADYQATWTVGCEELRELAIGRTLRVVTPNFHAEFDLPGFVAQMEKVYGVTQASLIERKAEVCRGDAVADPAPSP